MAITKLKSLILGDGDLKSLSASTRIRAGSVRPADVGTEDGVAFADGDVYIVINGSSSDVLQRKGGVWVSLLDAPVVTPLVDGQVLPIVAFSYPVANFPYAEVTYTIRRGSAHSQKRHGKMVILGDSGGTIQYSEELVELGTDVGVVMQPTIVGTNVEFHYTSTAFGTPIELEYTIKGWV